MRLFPKKHKGFFSIAENDRMIAAIRATEARTSGEIRVFVESRCRFVDPLERAAEIFWSLQMDRTRDRNSVLLYVAMKDHQFAIYADKGIHEKLGDAFWKKEIETMGVHFSQHHYIDALTFVINDIGEALHQHFPYDPAMDKNELPDDIVFGN